MEKSIDTIAGRMATVEASIVNLSSGALLFNDSSLPWTPDDFPNLPSTALAITVQGTIADRNLSTLTLTNQIHYAPFEPTTLQPLLTKTAQINQSGQVLFQEPTVQFLSTVNQGFQAPVTQFAPSTIGGAGIQDVTSLDADTLTNALGKLDSWITNAFLLQPPGIQPILSETNVFYGGVQWLNFPTFSILDKSVPYVNSILFIIGDPASSDYLTFELNDPTLFPYKAYRDGISPVLTPLVRFRIFTTCFLTTADGLYTKSAMQTKCVKIITERGNASFPSVGKVFAIEQTDGVSTYTTVSIFLPNLPISYPNGTPVPVKIVYLNKTSSPVTVTCTSTIQATSGNPGPVTSVIPGSATATSVPLTVMAPTYSDTTGLVTTPLFSTYQIEYTLQQMNSVQPGIGFRYGIPDPQTIPADEVAYSSNTFVQTIPFIACNYPVVLTGTVANPLLPGAQWSTSVAATNCAGFVGTQTPLPIVSTLFPTVRTPPLTNLPLLNTSRLQTRLASTMRTLAYNNGWYVSSIVGVDTFFLSTPSVLQYQLSTVAQWNDASYPGDRNTFSLRVYFTDDEGTQTNPITLSVPSVADDFPLNTPLTAATATESLTAVLTDSQMSTGFTHYFYNVSVSGSQTIAELSTATQSLYITLTNDLISNAVPIQQILSTSIYTFATEPANSCSTIQVLQEDCTNLTQVSGIYTPSLNSKFVFDIQATNFGNYFANSTIASASVTTPQYAVGPVASYTSNVFLYDGPTEVTTLPLPQNTILTISSCSVGIYSTIYQDPNDIQVMYLNVTVYPEAPQNQLSTFVTNLTSTLFIDTVSQVKLPSFSSTVGVNGLRVLSLLPRLELPGTVDNMNDGVDTMGMSGTGLDVTISSFASIDPTHQLNISTTLLYQHSSSISSIYTNVYSRELLYTDGGYIHPAGYNFSQFSGIPLKVPSAVYPDFTYDLIYDVNNGYRYATFLYELSTFATPTPISYLNVLIKNPSLVSTIQTVRDQNTFFPDDNITDIDMMYMKVRLHAKILTVYDTGSSTPFESAWVNGFKEIEDGFLDDTQFDIGACTAVSTIGSDVQYTIQFSRRYYTKFSAFIRIGIAQDGSVYSGDPITFESVQITAIDPVDTI